MSQAIISAADQAAWAGRSLVDNTITESGDLIILDNSSGAAVSVAGIDDTQVKGDLRRVINRGINDIALAAIDTAAMAKDQFATAAALAAGKSIVLFYNGNAWEPYTEA